MDMNIYHIGKNAFSMTYQDCSSFFVVMVILLAHSLDLFKHIILYFFFQFHLRDNMKIYLSSNKVIVEELYDWNKFVIPQVSQMLCINVPLWGEFTVYRWIPPEKGSNAKSISVSWRNHGKIQASLNENILSAFCSALKTKRCPDFI